MENHYVYCARIQRPGKVDSANFNIGYADELERRSLTSQFANPRSLQTVFVLGPFLDRDEARLVESDAHSILAKFRIGSGWFMVNPLELAEFIGWIDAQILPICTYEKGHLSKLSHHRDQTCQRQQTGTGWRPHIGRMTPRARGGRP